MLESLWLRIALEERLRMLDSQTGGGDCAAHSRATSGIIERSRVLYYVLCSRSLNEARSLPPLSWSRCHSHQAWHNFAFPQTSILIFSLLFGFYIYSADLQAKQAHQFTPPPPPPPRLPLLSLPSGGLAFVMCVIVTPSAPVFVLRRETSESSWITVWTTAATAASTAAAATATAAATTSLWGASTRGRTTTKEAGSSVRLSCRATGGSPACWGGSEEAWCHLGFNLFLSVKVQKNSPFDK